MKLEDIKVDQLYKDSYDQSVIKIDYVHNEGIIYYTYTNRSKNPMDIGKSYSLDFIDFARYWSSFYTVEGFEV